MDDAFVEVFRLRNQKIARRLRSVAVGLLAGTVVVAVYTLSLMRTLDQQPQVEYAPPPVTAPAFSLVDQKGQPFTNEDLSGKVWLAEMTFGLCPEDCTSLTGNFARVRDKLAATGLLGDHVMLVSFSGHPLVDTPETMAQLAARYDADASNWRFLTGSHDYLQQYTGANFFLPVDVLPYEMFPTDGPPPYAIVRSNRFVLVDKHGYVRNYFDGHRLHIEREMQFLLEEIRELLLEG